MARIMDEENRNMEAIHEEGEKHLVDGKPIYRGGTLDALSAMLSMLEKEPAVEEAMKQIEWEERENSRVLYLPENADDEQQISETGYLSYGIPDDLERSNSILLEPLAEGLKKGELAMDYYHIQPSKLSMLIRPGYKYKVERNLVLCALLMPRELLAIDDVNHIMMELGQPGIFEKTGNFRDNIRNKMVINLFEYAQTNECSRSRWLFLANDMLLYLDMEPLYHKKGHLPELSEEERALFDGWKAAAAEVSHTDGYLKFRRECFERYRERKGLSITNAQNLLANKTHITVDSVKNVLCATKMTPRTRSSRPTLALMAIEMGCSLDECNRILMEAGYPLLYPFRETEEDREYIFRLLKNSLGQQD